MKNPNGCSTSSLEEVFEINKSKLLKLYKEKLFLKTKIIKTFIIFLFLSLFIFSGNSYAQIKIGYVDSEVILKQLPEYQKIMDELEALQKLYLDTIQTKENELKEKAENFKTKYEEAEALVSSGQITSEEIKQLEAELANLQNEIRTLDEGLAIYKQKVQNDLLQKQAELFEPIKEKVTKVIEEVAKQMKINFVFDKADGILLYGDKEFDITFKVLDKLK